MPCLLVLVAFLSPRFALFLTWVFSDRLSAAFDDVAIPILGFFLLPWTTFLYAMVWSPVGGVSGIGWFLVVFGFLADLGSWGFGRSSRRSRRATA